MAEEHARYIAGYIVSLRRVPLPGEPFPDDFWDEETAA
jgi:hypothetical protein